jgi:CheY-like chemotaxis protein
MRPKMKKVLVVDDACDIAETTAMLLGLLGYDTRTAYNGREAVEAASFERPDVVLLDLNMPVLDGFAAAREIRDANQGPPPTLVALSAMSQLFSASAFQDSGFDYSMTKPADIDKLVAIIEGAA